MNGTKVSQNFEAYNFVQLISHLNKNMYVTTNGTSLLSGRYSFLYHTTNSKYM